MKTKPTKTKPTKTPSLAAAEKAATIASSTSAAHGLHIHLLDGFLLTFNGEPIRAFSNTRLQRLLAFLILNSDTPQSRQHLAALFWPDSSESQARTNLRNALHLLRTHLPLVEACIHSDNKSVTWRADAPAHVDLLEFDARYQEAIRATDSELAQIAFADAVAHYRGELLPDCYEDWILPLREEWQQRYYQALQHLAHRLEQQRKYVDAIEIAQKMMQIDPLQEGSYALLMSLQAARGDRAAALRTYHTCQTVLIDELGVEPGPATQSIYERLLNLDPDEVQTETLPRSAPLVGRDTAWENLQQAWTRATQGHAEMSLVLGEAGIGKSRLVEEWSTLLTRQGIITAEAYCYSAGGRLAYAPIQAWLRTPQIARYVEQLSAHHKQELFRLLPELAGDKHPAASTVSGAESMQRRNLFEAITTLFLQVEGPLLLLLDDIQWCDPDTLEWLEHLFQNAPQLRLLLIATLRMGEIAAEHPVHTLKYALGRNDRLNEIELDRFDVAATGQLVKTLAGREPTKAEVARIFADTDGNPLFVEEIVRSMAQTTAQEGDAGTSDEAVQPSLPPKIQSVVEARLVRLSPEARSLADVAAVLGRVFTTGLLASVTGESEDSLLMGLDELWQQQIIREHGMGIAMRDDSYDFAHDKLRDVVYQTLSPMRRRQLHRRAAEALDKEASRAAKDATEDRVSAQLASHYERAGLPLLAIQWYQKAAQSANQLSATQEALIHLDHALNLLDGIPGAGTPEADDEANLLELSIQMGRAPLLLATKGYAAPEAEIALTRAREISLSMGGKDDLTLRFKVMWGLSRFYQIQPNFERGMGIAEQMVAVAEEVDSSALRLEAYAALGTYYLHLGKFDTAIDYLDQSLALYNPTEHDQHAYIYGQDPKVVSLAYSAWTLFCLGRREEAQTRVDEALAWATSLEHPYSLVIAQTYAAVQAQFLDDATVCLTLADAASKVATEHGFLLWVSMSGFLRGWSMCRLDQAEVGVELMQTSASLYRSTGAKTGACYFAALLSETMANIGQPDVGQMMCGLALAQFEETQESWCEAELYRIQGSILRVCDQPEEAAAAFEKALSVATAQGALWWVERTKAAM